MTVNDLQLHDAAGNAGTSGTDSVAIDTVNPTVTVNIVDLALNDADNSSLVTFTFSEAPVGFSDADLNPVGGSISPLIQDTLTTYHATFTAADGITTTGSVTVGTGWTDAVGNTGVGGSDNVAIDTENPTVIVNIVDASLDDAQFELGRQLHFQRGDNRLRHRRPFLLRRDLVRLLGSGTSYSATFTAADPFSGPAPVSVNDGSYHDAAGNAGGAGSDVVAIDTQNPSVTVDIVDASLSDGDNSSVVNFTFSEATTNFDINDISVSNGTLSAFSGSGTSYSVIFTANDSTSGTGSVSVNDNSYTDAAGNLGTGDSEHGRHRHAQSHRVRLTSSTRR